MLTNKEDTKKKLNIEPMKVFINENFLKQKKIFNN